jgi:CHRD domain
MTRVRHFRVGITAVIVATAVGVASPASADHNRRAPATVMKGAEEVPGPGAPDGIGIAGVLINVNRGRICYALAVKNIEPAIAAHIHVGADGTAPPNNIVVPLDAPTPGYSANCTDVGQELAGQIAAAPDQYYVNVHTPSHPAGAIRGQLG